MLRSPQSASRGRYNPLEKGEKGEDFPEDGGEVAIGPGGGKAR